MPSLAQFNEINNNFDGMPVRVEPIPGKGLGLVAQHDMEAGVPTCYYFVRLYKIARVQQSPYLIGSGGAAGYVGALFRDSFRPPGDDRIPYVAPIANEPTGRNGEPNCRLRDETPPNRWLRKTSLVTLRSVRKGEELVWDYGPDYGPRAYESRYDSM